MASWRRALRPSRPCSGRSLPLRCSVDPTYPAGDARPPPCVSPALAGSVVWAPQKGGTAGQVGTGRPRSRGRPDPGLTCKRTGSPRPRLSETTSVMAVLRTVARNVLTPKTKAQSSFEREDAIWKLKEKAGGHAARGTADATVPRGHPVGARGQPCTQCWARPTKAT